MKKILNYLNLFLVSTILIISSIIFPVNVQASTSFDTTSLESDVPEIIGDLSDLLKSNSIENIANQIIGNTFYIKNAYSGRYLDVYRGIAADGTNVQQCSFNGGNNQQWYMNYNGDGTFSIVSQINTNYVLDVYGASSENYANINIWTNHGGDSEKFKIYYTENSVYKIASKISNYEKCLTVENMSCVDEGNVMQHAYNKSWNDLWILEPVSTNAILGAQYAIDNHDQYVSAYPGCSSDCTNFASQCLLATGLHYDSDWRIYRKNGTYNTNIDSNYKLKYSWDTSVPGSWVTAKNFKDYWLRRSSNVYKLLGSSIVNDPSVAWNLPISIGCVIQISEVVNGVSKDPYHTMYISDYTNDGGNKTYKLTYHSTNTESKSLLDICRTYPDQYFWFFKTL